MIKILVSVPDYCKKYKITDAAARKRMKGDDFEFVTLNDTYYMVENSNFDEEQSIKIKLLNSKLKLLNSKLKNYDYKSEEVRELKERNILLEQDLRNQREKTEIARDKLDEVREGKEGLYEKVLGTLLLPKPNFIEEI